MIARRAVPGLLAAAVLLVPAACRRSVEPPSMTSALEAVPLRLTGDQTVEIQLAARQPATGGCLALAAGERLRIDDGGLTVSVPASAPPAGTGQVRIVPGTTTGYVVGDDGRATAWVDATLATGDEGDVAGFVGLALRQTSPLGDAAAVTWLAQALDDAGAYAAVLRGPPGPPDAPGAVWTATGATTDGRVVTARADGHGVTGRRAAFAADPCAYRS